MSCYQIVRPYQRNYQINLQNNEVPEASSSRLSFILLCKLVRLLSLYPRIVHDFWATLYHPYYVLLYENVIFIAINHCCALYYYIIVVLFVSFNSKYINGFYQLLFYYYADNNCALKTGA